MDASTDAIFFLRPGIPFLGKFDHKKKKKMSVYAETFYLD